MTPSERTSLFRTAEHRQYRRYPTDLTATVWSAEADGTAAGSPTRSVARADRPRTAYVENLSLAGLYFVSDCAYPVDSLVWVRLRVGAQTVQFKAQVRRSITVRLTGQRCFGSGVQFVRAAETVQGVGAIAPYLDRLRAKIAARPAS